MTQNLSRALIATLLTFLGAPNVSAFTWTFEYAGTISLNPCFPDSAWCSNPWNPILAFDTISDTDGSYSGSFTGEFPYAPDNTVVSVAISNTFLLGGDLDTGPYSNFSDGSFHATITGRRVVDFGGFFAADTEQGPQYWSIASSSISYGACCVWSAPSQAFAIAIPEPTSYALLGSGLALLYGMRKRTVSVRRTRLDDGRVISSRGLTATDAAAVRRCGWPVA